MKETIKKGLFFGVGLFEETREKAAELVDEMIKKGELVKEERSKTIDKYVEKIKEQEKVIVGKINEEIKHTIDRLGIPTKEEFEKLSKEVETLKKKVQSTSTRKKNK